MIARSERGVPARRFAMQLDHQWLPGRYLLYLDVVPHEGR